MKKKAFLLACAAATLGACCRQTPEPAIPADRDIERSIGKILKNMTLEEKVGQMTQITATVIAEGLEITPAGDSILRVHKIGSVLNTPGEIAQSPQAYEKFISELQRISLETTGIPCLYGLDHIHGTSYVLGGTELRSMK